LNAGIRTSGIVAKELKQSELARWVVGLRAGRLVSCCLGHGSVVAGDLKTSEYLRLACVRPSRTRPRDDTVTHAAAAAAAAAGVVVGTSGPCRSPRHSKSAAENFSLPYVLKDIRRTDELKQQFRESTTLNPLPPSDAVRKQENLFYKISSVQYSHNSKNTTPLKTLNLIIYAFSKASNCV